MDKKTKNHQILSCAVIFSGNTWSLCRWSCSLWLNLSLYFWPNVTVTQCHRDIGDRLLASWYLSLTCMDTSVAVPLRFPFVNVDSWQQTNCSNGNQTLMANCFWWLDINERLLILVWLCQPQFLPVSWFVFPFFLSSCSCCLQEIKKVRNHLFLTEVEWFHSRLQASAAQCP